MTKKKMPQTIEECNTEMELTQKKIRQYENRGKMLDRKLAIEKRKECNHCLCSRGGYMESITQELFQTGKEALYCGLNALSNNLIMVDRKLQMKTDPTSALAREEKQNET